MAIHWRLKTYLAIKHGIYGATAFQKLIVRKTGVLISLQNLCNYIEKKPKMIPLQTMELLITALGCRIEDFCHITPCSSFMPKIPKKLSYKNTPLSKRSGKTFPNPEDYKP